MLRRFTVTVSALALFTLSGCDILDVASGGEPLTEAGLTGKHLLFTNPNPNIDIGQHSEWEYTFRSGKAMGCNDRASYTSTGWRVIGDSRIRVYFGEHYEEYTLESMDGSLSDGTLWGTFHLESSVPGNVVEGSFRQIGSNIYC